MAKTVSLKEEILRIKLAYASFQTEPSQLVFMIRTALHPSAKIERDDGRQTALLLAEKTELEGMAVYFKNLQTFNRLMNECPQAIEQALLVVDRAK